MIVFSTFRFSLCLLFIQSYTINCHCYRRPLVILLTSGPRSGLMAEENQWGSKPTYETLFDKSKSCQFGSVFFSFSQLSSAQFSTAQHSSTHCSTALLGSPLRRPVQVWRDWSPTFFVRERLSLFSHCSYAFDAWYLIVDSKRSHESVDRYATDISLNSFAYLTVCSFETSIRLPDIRSIFRQSPEPVHQTSHCTSRLCQSPQILPFRQCLRKPKQLSHNYNRKQ